MSYRESSLVDDWTDRLYPTEEIVVDLFLPEVKHQRTPIKLQEARPSDLPSKNLASRAGVLVREYATNDKAQKLGIHTVVWRLVGSTILLEPLDLSGRARGYSGLRIRSPADILDHCIALSDVGDKFVLDFITIQGFLYTIELPYTQFVPGEGIDLGVASKTPWRSIKQPYAFDMVSPVLLKAVSAEVLLVSLVDGSLVELKRHVPLGDISSRTLDDPHSPTGLARLLSGSSDKVPGHANLSVRTIVSISVLGDYLVTLSANNTIKLWSLRKGGLLQQLVPSDRTPAFYKLRPSTFVASDSAGKYVSIYTPIGGKPHMKIYRLVRSPNDTATLEDLGVDFEVAAPPETANWFLADYTFSQTKTESNGFSILGGWKSNFNSLIVSIDFVPGEAPKFREVSRHEASALLRIPDEEDLEKFIRHIFTFVDYSRRTLREALLVFSPESEIDESTTSLQELVTAAVEKAVAEADDHSQQNSRLQWMRLDRLSREIEAHSREILALQHDPTDNLVWSIRSSYFSILSHETFLQTILRQSSSTDGVPGPYSTLVSTVRNVYLSVPRSVTSQFEAALLRDVSEQTSELLIERMGGVFANIIQTGVGANDMESIRRAVAKLPNVDTLLPQLLEKCFPENMKPLKVATQPFTPLGAELMARLISEFAVDASAFLASFTLFTLIAYNEGWVEDGVALFARALGLFKRSQVILALQDPMSNQGAGSDYNPRASALVVCTSTLGLSISDGNFSELSLLLWRILDFSTPSERAFKLFTKLVDEKLRAKSLINLSRYLPRNASGTFICACAYLSIPQYAYQGERLARQAAIALAHNIYQELAFVGKGLNSGLPAYYDLMSKTAERLGELPTALRLARLAADGGSVGEIEHLLKVGLAVGDLEASYTAIAMLQRSGVGDLKKELLGFLEVAISQHSADRVTRSLPFMGLSDQVQEVLASQAFIGDIPAYKLLYTWCINREDYIGAASGIYKQIAKLRGAAQNKNATENVGMFDLYTIVLNVLKLGRPENRWFVVRDRIVTYDDVRREYKTLTAGMASQLKKQPQL